MSSGPLESHGDEALARGFAEQVAAVIRGAGMPSRPRSCSPRRSRLASADASMASAPASPAFGAGDEAVASGSVASRSRSPRRPGQPMRPRPPPGPPPHLLLPVPVCYPAINAQLRVLGTVWREGGRLDLLCELLPRPQEDQRPRRVWLTAWSVAVLDGEELLDGRWRAHAFSSEPASR